MKVYNGENMILGRLAARVAKDALLGEEVKVINCEKVVVSGQKQKIFAAMKQKYDRRGYPTKSANLSRLPERFVRRSIRGMLPWKQARGREAFDKIMCYRGVPDSLKDAEVINLKEASLTKLPTLKYVRVAQICAQLGGNK